MALLRAREPAERANEHMSALAQPLGGRRWIQRQFDRVRTYDGWTFPAGSSGPFGDDLLGRWLSHDELCATAQEFLRLRQEAPQNLLWASAGLGTNPFWADLHARSD